MASKTTKVTSGEQIAMDLALGRHDADIKTIFEALLTRLSSNDLSVGWKLTLPDLELVQDDLTLDEAVRLEQESGFDWATMPKPLASAEHARRFLVMFFEKRLGLSPDDAAARVATMTALDTLDAFSLQVADVPKD